MWNFIVASLLFISLFSQSLQKFVQVPKPRRRSWSQGSDAWPGGSRFVTDNEFKFVARMQNSEGEMFSGALISQNVVVTLASNVQGQSTIIIQLSSADQLIEINNTNIVIHENYFRGKYEDNIALLFLPNNSIPTGKFESIRLPSVVEKRAGEKLFNYFPVQVIGWGDPDHPDELRSVDAVVLPSENCTEDRGWDITSKLVCTKPDVNYVYGPCKNEIGAPMIFLELDDIQTMVGLLIDSDCPVILPPVYLRMSEYIYWIEKQGGPRHNYC